MRLSNVHVRPTLGIEVGASLIVSQLAAHHSIDAPLCLCDLAIAHCVYGRDRLLDQLSEPNMTSPEPCWGAQIPAVTTTAAWIGSSYYLALANQAYVVPVLALLVTAYPRIKTACGPFKPALIGGLWAYAIVCLPTAETVSPMLYPFASLLFTAASNVADIKDETEDRVNNVRTFAVEYGSTASYMLSGVLAASAIAIHQYVPMWTWGDIYNDVAACVIMSICSWQLVVQRNGIQKRYHKG